MRNKNQFKQGKKCTIYMVLVLVIIFLTGCHNGTIPQENGDIIPIDGRDGAFHASRDLEPLYKERFEKVTPFVGDYAAVMDISGDWFHINKRGKRIYDSTFAEVGAFHGGVARAKNDQQEWFFIDISGRPIFSNRFKYLGFYSEGKAAGIDITGRWVHIDRLGNVLHDKGYKMLFEFHEGFAVAVNQDDQWFHINEKEEPIYDERYTFASDFDGGIARVSKGRGYEQVSFLINADGKPISGKQYDKIGEFHDGIAAVIDSSGSYHINKEEQPLYEERYYVVDSFYDGGLAVAKDTLLDGEQNKLKQFYINIKGEIVFDRNYDLASDFQGESAIVQQVQDIWADSKLISAVDQSGHVLFEGEYRDFNPYYRGFADLYSEEGEMTIIDEMGERIETGESSFFISHAFEERQTPDSPRITEAFVRSGPYNDVTAGYSFDIWHHRNPTAETVRRCEFDGYY